MSAAGSTAWSVGPLRPFQSRAAVSGMATRLAQHVWPTWHLLQVPLRQGGEPGQHGKLTQRPLPADQVPGLEVADACGE